jgi:2-dehydropantoate 2-reductase
VSRRIALVGPGAIGSTVAALLHAAGHQVVLCGHTPRASIEVRPDPQTGIGGPIVLPGPVLTDPTAIDRPVDIVLLAVKDTQNADAAPWLARLCDPRTVACVLQNGVEQVERVGRYCPAGTAVVPAAVWFSAETQPEGWVRVRLGVWLTLPDDDIAAGLAEILRVPGMTVQLDADFVTATWRKLLTNAAAGFMVLTGRRLAMFRRDDIAALARDYTAECLAVARAEGAKLDDDIVNEIPASFAAVPEDMTTSILTDRESGRPLEWDVRNGVILRKAREHGLPAPISEILVPLLATASDGPG